jgi:excisionase family DNA binding protein
MEKLYTVKETMEMLRISRPTLYRIVRSDALRSVKVKGKTLFKESELERYFQGLNGKSSERK